MEEIWRPVYGFEGIYKVSNFGNIVTIKTGRIKKPTTQKRDKRQYVLLWKNNTYKLMKVHRIVLLSFKGEPPPGMECCHNDGNPENNLLDNLRWDTAQNNQRDRVKHGTSNRGERCAAAKLTTEQVIAIRNDPRQQKEIAKDYGVRPSQISRIKNKIRWGHID